MLLIKDKCVATIQHVRYTGTAFVLPVPHQHILIPDTPFDQLWCLFVYSGTRTAEEDWYDFGKVDHIMTKERPDFRQGGDSKGILILAPGKWSWKGEEGVSTDEDRQ
jgi:hypothetical protein